MSSSSSSTSSPTPPTNTPFKITSPPSTDIWRKPPSTNVFTAPRLLRPLTPLSHFHRARVTFSATWTERYDQAGLLLVLTKRSQGKGDGDGEGMETAQWLKTGIEFYEGRSRLSTVGCDTWADWSIAEVPSPRGGSSGITGAEGKEEVTIEVRREGDELGSSLWVYYLMLDSTGEVKERVPLREVNWFFADQEKEEVEVRVGAFVARPAKVEGELEVKFRGFECE